jgi:hypothetical protein
MLKLLFVRARFDATEEHQIRKLARSRHAPGHWMLRVRVIPQSWERTRTAI